MGRGEYWEVKVLMRRVKYDRDTPDIRCRWLCGTLPVLSFFFSRFQGNGIPIKNSQYVVDRERAVGDKGS